MSLHRSIYSSGEKKLWNGCPQKDSFRGVYSSIGNLPAQRWILFSWKIKSLYKTHRGEHSSVYKYHK